MSDVGERITTRYPNAWHAATDYLRQLGLELVFGLPADDLEVLPAVESARLRIMLCRDQRNAAFMATGYAAQSGKPGVCVLGKGPAITNALTGLLEARSSAVPLVVLAAGTGQDRRGSGAFQELDQIAVTTPVVKWAHRVDHPDRVIPALEKAFLAATGGVPGPVYLEFPDHLLRHEIIRGRPWSGLPRTPRGPVTDPVDHAVVDALLTARRPTVLAGGGMRHHNADRIVERFAERIGALLISTASGRGCLDENHGQFGGLAGLYAPSETTKLLKTTDLVVALGSRLEETATFGWPGLGTTLPVLQVNIDPLDLSTEYWGPKVAGDAASALRSWLGVLPDDHEPDPGWLGEIGRCRETLRHDRRETLALMGKSDDLHVAEVLAAIEKVVPPERILVQENGLQDMWSYHYPFYTCAAEGGSIVPSEQTSLGFGVSAAAGVRLAAPDRPVVVFAGDGAFAMGHGDLGTVVREGIGVLYVVLHNGGYGWLHNQLDRHALDATRYPFVSKAGAVPRAGDLPGLDQFVLTRKDELERELERGLHAGRAGRVAVLHVPVRLDDVPPGLDVLDGDFPEAGATDQGLEAEHDRG
ncbi:thiamine pyrophosphate-binding protein [Amycolatopsis sp. NPDC059021]|uniref:thiamine pyrophosphate-binding protein n=1 Tax=Amycolatopsis sp. NPDC059021 TaxID=3346704 RepID=UPI00366CDB6F